MHQNVALVLIKYDLNAFIDRMVVKQNNLINFLPVFEFTEKIQS